MKIDVKDKYFWFVFFELVCGFVASIAWMGDALTGDGSKNHDAYNVIHGVCISGAFFPIVFRSMVFTYGKDLGKPTFLTLMITALCMYIIGGAVWLIDKGGAVRGAFAIAAGVLAMVDMILKVLGK